jgi:hypothetical protein
MIRQLLSIPRVLPMMLALMAATVPVEAQEVSKPDAEPAVNTSRPAPAAEEPAVSTSGNSPGTPEAPADTSTAQPSQDSAQPATTRRRFRTMDRLDLDASAITGNQELPKVLYIVPWKKAELGDVAGRPSNSLLDEVLTPVDRDVFRRQTAYFSKLESSAAAQQAGQQPAAEGAPREQAQGSAAKPPQGQQPGQN